MPKKSKGTKKKTRLKKDRKTKLLSPSSKKQLEEHYKNDDQPPKIIKSKNTVPLASIEPSEPMSGDKVLNRKKSPHKKIAKKVKLAPLDLPIKDYDGKNEPEEHKLESEDSQVDMDITLEEDHKPLKKQQPATAKTTPHKEQVDTTKSLDDNMFAKELADFIADQQSTEGADHIGEDEMKDILTNLEGLEGIPAETGQRKMAGEDDDAGLTPEQVKQNYHKGDYHVPIKNRSARGTNLYIVEIVVVLALIAIFLTILVDAEVIDLGFSLPFDFL